MTARELPLVEAHFTSPPSGYGGFQFVAASAPLSSTQKATLASLGVYPNNVSAQRGFPPAYSFHKLDAEHFALSEMRPTNGVDQWGRDYVPYARHAVLAAKDLYNIDFDIGALLAHPSTFWSPPVAHTQALPHRVIPYNPASVADVRLPPLCTINHLASLIEKLLDIETDEPCTIVASDPDHVRSILVLAWAAIPVASRALVSFHTFLAGGVIYDAYWQFAGCQAGLPRPYPAFEIDLTSGSEASLRTRYAPDCARAILDKKWAYVAKLRRCLDDLNKTLTVATIDQAVVEIKKKVQVVASLPEAPSKRRLPAAPSGKAAKAPVSIPAPMGDREAVPPAQKLRPFHDVQNVDRFLEAVARLEGFSSLLVEQDYKRVLELCERWSVSELNDAKSQLLQWPVLHAIVMGAADACNFLRWLEQFLLAIGAYQAGKYLEMATQRLYKDAAKADGRLLWFITAFLQRANSIKLATTIYTHVQRNDTSPSLVAQQELLLASNLFAIIDGEARVEKQLAYLAVQLGGASNDVRMGALALAETLMQLYPPKRSSPFVTLLLRLDDRANAHERLVDHVVRLLDRWPDGRAAADALMTLEAEGQLDTILTSLFAAFAKRPELKAEVVVSTVLSRWQELHDVVSATQLIQAFRGGMGAGDITSPAVEKQEYPEPQ